MHRNVLLPEPAMLNWFYPGNRFLNLRFFVLTTGLVEMNRILLERVLFSDSDVAYYAVMFHPADFKTA